MSIPEKLFFKQFPIGPMENFSYFIGDAQTKQIAVVDPAWDADFICSEADKLGVKITAIFLTHSHMDHINAMDNLLSRYDIPVYISKDEHSFSNLQHKNFITTKNQQNITIGNIKITCILTPGHTPGGQCFKYENILITGDILFIDGCGRCDLPGGNAREMYHTLYDIIMKLPETTIIYPGHHYGSIPFATLAEQKKTNPYLSYNNVEEFLNERI